jgi:hypothetical protein
MLVTVVFAQLDVLIDYYNTNIIYFPTAGPSPDGAYASVLLLQYCHDHRPFDELGSVFRVQHTADLPTSTCHVQIRAD